MREIEVKVRAQSLERVIKQLESLGVEVSEPVTQQDQVFGLPGESGNDDNTAPWLRIRTEIRGSVVRTLFTLKRSVTNQLDSIEHETEIGDANELASIISQLGFIPYSDITKTRRTARMEGMELCIDTVERLGDFVEVEKLTDEDVEYSVIVAEIWQLLESFGFTQADEVTDGYDVLINNLG